MSIKAKAKADVKKEIMISSLVKDISAINAVLDLVDNSIDSAIVKGDLENTLISIESNEERIVVFDNCCGISLDDLENKVFIFGKDRDYNGSEHNSIGRFGIGMKRAIFKLGSEAEIHTKYDDLEYRIVIDKSYWLENDDWEFEIFDDEPLDRDEERYTSIVIKGLNNIIDNEKLYSALVKTYSRYIQKGVTINLNRKVVSNIEPKLISSDTIRPFKKNIIIGGVKATVICGIDNFDPQNTGWNIYCNDRLILENDKSENTGWTVEYHANYAAFRGYVFLESNDNLELPITSTKVGVDFDHKNYSKIKSCMSEGFISVKEHLYAISKLKQETKKIIKAEWESMPRASVFNITKSEDSSFILSNYINYPKNTKTINFEVDIDEFILVSNSLGINSAKEVGKKLFEVYLKKIKK